MAAYNRGMSVNPYNRPPSVDRGKNVSDGDGAQACGERCNHERENEERGEETREKSTYEG